MEDGLGEVTGGLVTREELLQEQGTGCGVEPAGGSVGKQSPGLRHAEGKFPISLLLFLPFPASPSEGVKGSQGPPEIR